MNRRPAAKSAPLTQDTTQAGTEEFEPEAIKDQPLDVNVLFTTHSGTLAALRWASRLGANLEVTPRVLILYAVPFTLPLEERVVPRGLLEDRVGALRREFPTPISARICLCRDPQWSLRQILKPHSLIVMGGEMHWWPTEEQRMARTLVREGHEVIFVPLA